MAISVTLKAKGKVSKLPSEVTLKQTDTAAALVSVIAEETGLGANRIRLTVKGDKPASEKSKSKDKVLSNSDKLASFATDKALTVSVRDLGPQIAWRTVFLIEYLGPVLIHPIFYFGQKLVYGKAFEHSQNQKLLFVCVLLHFIKREIETAFVHKFSLATMPFFNLFKNCSHYWLLSGVLLAYFSYAPASFAQGSILNKFLYGNTLFEWDSNQIIMLGVAWLFAELSNLTVHLNLASLRSSGSTERKIPYGYGFDKVSCPNYFFEAWGWFVLSCVGQNWSIWLFFIVGSLQMYFWAVKKHKRYLAEFPDYPKDRTAFIPYLC